MGHQPPAGVRVADVVATTRCQCLRLGEAEYWWLVDRQPAVQERISRLRRLLPRLELAQVRASPLGPTGARRNGASSSTSRRASSRGSRSSVRPGPSRAARSCVREGDPADAFYVLISGHLRAVVGGRIVRRARRGDGFGEIALLHGGPRTATISVVSADADLLVMRRPDFDMMLATMPAFAWEVWEAAASRDEVGLS